MIIDSHTHLGLLNQTEFKPQDLIASMDAAGIDYSLVISDFGLEPEGKYSNEEIVKICSENPRLKAVGNVHFPGLNEVMINQLKDYLAKGLIHGVKFYPGYQDFYPNDHKLYPIYEDCQENNKTVMFHTGIIMAGKNGLLKQVHPLEIDEVATRFPKLKILMAHMGNPWTEDCAIVMLKNPNVYTDLSGFFEEFKPILAEDVAWLYKNLKYFQSFLGNLNKFLFGTDWPINPQKEYLKAIQEFPLTEAEKELVFWKNAVNVFNVKVAEKS